MVSKRERETLRLRMLEEGAEIAAIATKMQSTFDFRPREAWRHAHGWTQREAADRYNAHESSGSAPLRDGRIAAFEKWPDSGRRPSFSTLMLLAQTYECTVADLLDDRDQAQFPKAEWSLLAFRRTLEPQLPPRLTVSEVLMDAARESADFAHRVGQTNVGPTDLDQLDAEMDRIARRYISQPLPGVVTEILRLRTRVAHLIDGRQYPTQAKHLYLLAAQSYGLLAAGCTDLGHHDDADTHARTAALCADLAEHPPLRAWVFSLRSGIALWDGRSDDAINHARAGLSLIGDSTEKIRLHSLLARAEGRRGNGEAVTDAIRAAQRARENTTDDSNYVGMFAFPLANEIRCAGTAQLWVGQPQEAARSFEEALELYSHGDGDNSYAHIAVTRIDLAMAHLSDGDIEAAHDALSGVLALPAQQRLDGIVRRVPRLRQALTAPALTGQSGIGAMLDALNSLTEHTAAEAYETLAARELQPGMITP